MKLLFFAQSAEWMRRREMQEEVSGPVALVDFLKSRPDFAPLLAHRQALKVAVNCEYADFDAEVRNGDEVAFLPPVSGG